jgi:hypothetical protein
MPRAAVTKTNAPGCYGSALTALTMTAADPTNKNSVQLTGDDKEILVIHNSHASNPYTVTLTSAAAKDTGRLGDITAESIPAGAYRTFGPFKLNGWAQTSNLLHLEAENAAVKFGVIKLP